MKQVLSALMVIVAILFSSLACPAEAKKAPKKPHHTTSHKTARKAPKPVARHHAERKKPHAVTKPKVRHVPPKKPPKPHKAPAKKPVSHEHKTVAPKPVQKKVSPSPKPKPVLAVKKPSPSPSPSRKSSRSIRIEMRPSASSDSYRKASMDRSPDPVATPPILDQRFRPLINEVMTADVSRLKDGHDLRAKYYLYFKSMVLHEDAGYERFNESFGLFRLSVARILRNELEYRLKLARDAEKAGKMSPEVKKLLSEGDVGCAENNLPTGGLCDAIDATSIEGIENSLDKLRFQVKELDDDRKE